MSTLPLLRLVPGLVVYDTERRYIVVDLLNTTTALVEDDQKASRQTSCRTTARPLVSRAIAPTSTC
jgi:hypothetical protein